MGIEDAYAGITSPKTSSRASDKSHGKVNVPLVC